MNKNTTHAEAESIRAILIGAGFLFSSLIISAGINSCASRSAININIGNVSSSSLGEVSTNNQ